MKLLVIFNPQAAYGRSIKKLPEIEARMLSSGIQTDIKFTSHPGHGSKLAASAGLSAYDGVVAAGGDGTLFEVLNGLYQQPKTKRVPLGLLPIGTGNAFARDLDLQPFNLSAAIDILAKGRTRLVDVGHVKCVDVEYHFLNVTHMGFSVDASKTARKLKFIGNTAYTIGTLWQALMLKSYPLVIELDGKEICQDNIFTTISNTQYTGTHFLIAPGAVIDDGLLDVTLLRRFATSPLATAFSDHLSRRAR